MTTSTAVTVIDKVTGEVTETREAFDFATYLAALGTDGLTRQQALAAAYDAACHALVGPNDVQVEGGRSFKKKSAWRKIGRHFNISTAVIREDVRPTGEDWLAVVTVRASAPWGQSAEAVGACGSDEATGRRTITLADGLATAQTRATNRAISDLVAMGEVSAEELGGRAPHTEAPRSVIGQGSNVPAPPASPSAAKAVPAAEAPPCPKCGGRMWDNKAESERRVSEGRKQTPWYKCRDKACDGVIWPPRARGHAGAGARTFGGAFERGREDLDAVPAALEEPEDGLPF